MTEIRAIPMLPCAAIQETLDFYVAMGFHITYQQTRPGGYGCVAYGEIDLHFFTLKGYEPANSYSSCLILVPDADALYRTFAAGLRQSLGKVLIAGIPRITKPSNKNRAGDYRFNVIDPGGNWIRFVQQVSKPAAEEITDDGVMTKLGRAIRAADLLVNGKADFAAAAVMLDTVLTVTEDGENLSQQAQALVLRAEIAMNLEDPAMARALLARLEGLSLTEGERVALYDVLQQAADLAAMLG